MNNRLYGAAGERAAEAYLLAAGAKVLARNYRCPMGEIDLIVELEGAIVFVEVKRRASAAFGRPAEAVTRAKQAAISRAATWYLKRRHLLERSVRFDVVEVMGETVRHLRAAFYPSRT